MSTVYKSKVDLWIGALMVLVIAVSVMDAFRAFATPGYVAYWHAVLVFFVGVCVPLIALSTIRYVLDDETLVVSCGPIVWRIPVADIVSITPTHTLIASPALSLDRLNIRHSIKKSIIISPRKKEAFLQQLYALRPELDHEAPGSNA